MEIKYSKKEFEGYTHRFVVELQVGSVWPSYSAINIYSNSDSYQKLSDFINEKKSEKVISFDIIHRATKEQDDAASVLIEEVLREL